MRWSSVHCSPARLAMLICAPAGILSTRNTEAPAQRDKVLFPVSSAYGGRDIRDAYYGAAPLACDPDACGTPAFAAFGAERLWADLQRWQRQARALPWSIAAMAADHRKARHRRPWTTHVAVGTFVWTGAAMRVNCAGRSF